jgi:hypothetical protein
MTDPVPGMPVADVLAGLEVPALPGGAAPTALFALIQYQDADGDDAWAVRVTSGLADDELLGVLSGYVEHLKQAAAASWDDFGTTRADPK